MSTSRVTIMAPDRVAREAPEELGPFFVVSIDDGAGADPLGEHWHDDVGHAFPMTREQLLSLRAQIDHALWRHT